MYKHEIIFGDKTTFAIRYVSGYKYKDNPQWLFAYLHLMLREHLIGDKDESCSVEKLWIYNIDKLKKELIETPEHFTNPEFENLIDDEIFELINKANQSENEYKSEFIKLPQLNYDIWNSCCISIDETTDGYCIVLVQISDKLKFIWECRSNVCPEDEKGKRFSVTVDKNFVLKVIDDCIKYVENDYKNYSEVE